MLPLNDLTMMNNEMTSKVTKLSNELVSLLQTRDVLQLETVAKNRFIQAMLRVQESKHAMQNTGGPGGIDSSLEEKGISVPTGGDDTRLKRRSRSMSFHNISRSLIAKAKSLGTVEEDKTSSEMVCISPIISCCNADIYCISVIFVCFLIYCCSYFEWSYRTRSMPWGRGAFLC